MYTKEALRALGVTGAAFTDEQHRELDRDGFFIVPQFFSPQQCRLMAAEADRLHAAEGHQGGHEVHVEPGASLPSGYRAAAGGQRVVRQTKGAESRNWWN